MGAGLWWMPLMVFLRETNPVDNTQCTTLPSVTVPEKSKVLIPCPPVASQHREIKYQLLLQQNENMLISQFEVTVEDDGQFICKQEVIYPPPHQNLCNTIQVVTEPLPVTNITEPTVTPSCPDVHSLDLCIVLWAVSGFLLIYGLILTCVTVALWRKVKSFKNEMDNPIYSNTRPPGKS